MTPNLTDFENTSAIFPACRSFLGDAAWEGVLAGLGATPRPEEVIEALLQQTGQRNLPEFITDLARIEVALSEARGTDVPASAETLGVNPSVRLLDVSWAGLPSLLSPDPHRSLPEHRPEIVVVWKDPVSLAVRAEAADHDMLLVLKLITEGVDREQAAAEAAVHVRVIDKVFERVAARGVVLAPASRIRRDRAAFQPGRDIPEDILSSPTFTLQWHITQACDLHCKHCYDRSERSGLPFDSALRVLDDLYDFCRQKDVRGQVSFTGGNPFLYPRFSEVYRAAADRGFMTAVLGNPVSRERLLEILAIQRPVYFQVSLEGLEEHNDHIRGTGHFRRTLASLELLRELGIYSMVMLTLTEDNLDQVLPLGEVLRDRTDLFTFNRLAMVGEGANLRLPPPAQYAAFLERYIDACEGNPVLGLKDNLLNIIYHQRGTGLFSGCTGHGCGAAFNFIALLPDGEVHACRKFPSPVGNIFQQRLTGIYDAESARRYRQGCSACSPCVLRHVCGGCLAVAYGHGLDVCAERDPYCFLNTPPTLEA